MRSQYPNNLARIADQYFIVMPNAQILQCMKRAQRKKKQNHLCRLLINGLAKNDMIQKSNN